MGRHWWKLLLILLAVLVVFRVPVLVRTIWWLLPLGSGFDDLIDRRPGADLRSALRQVLDEHPDLATEALRREPMRKIVVLLALAALPLLLEGCFWNEQVEANEVGLILGGQGQVVPIPGQ